ncbi:tyrosine phosphatase [Kwoniella mangroviensis CBS 10435]|uniref:Putative tyrosine-protein phosphatase OCA1 n=1 Tax=Kwoniella mangroviensis CBS 10435 TaxID=1331196 RepID=A0A1B9IJK7_9TREE|nr:tyrosine phosphatase [Kwoniella mangroviensis CBS 8507]OCF55826.1 tyrosine phosphatase [Kwoniella mangroviensis CBS 10435]OCF65600.1 tyrosine phosphatase [Kwoniella mangroviensis CBS 8507]OCF71678.1 tyrosine phosphatase [Kwoniella mangroviensis CBS 8886]
MAKIVPPMNFGLVEDGFYRSAQPSELNFSFLEKLNLKTIIWVGAEEPSEILLSFLNSQGITLHNLAPQVSLNPHFPPPYTDSGVVPISDHYHLPPLPPPPEPLIIQSLTLLLRPTTFPTLVCCNMGRHRTGTVVGCYRKLQRWALSSILEEYRRYAGMKVRILNEQFIELFDTDLVSITAEQAVA